MPKKNPDLGIDRLYFVDEVTGRMHKPCDECGRIPKKQRLRVQRGAGRFITTECYCRGCGHKILFELTSRIGGMMVALSSGKKKYKNVIEWKNQLKEE